MPADHGRNRDAGDPRRDRRPPEPPRLARRLLERLLPPGRGAELIEDLDEEFHERTIRHGRISAALWYWLQALRPSTTSLGRELREVRTMKVGRHKVPGLAPKGVLDFLLTELKYAFRSIRKRPGFSAVVILTLALGIGANTAIFTVVNGVLLSPLGYPDPDRLISVGVDWVGDGSLGNMSLPDILDVESQSRGLGSLVGYSPSTGTLTGLGEPTLVSVTRVHRGLLSVFGLAPVVGRDIADGESGASPANVVMIGHGVWRDQFDSDPGVVGRTVMIDGSSLEIVGVAPEGFDFPGEAQFWVPRGMNPENCARGCHAWRTIGRLASGASVAGVRAEADAIAARLSASYPDSNIDKTFLVRTLQEDVVRRAKTGLWLLLGAGLAVLLIACANVANLVLARADQRRGEAAVRSAMGASRGRLVASMLSESALLAVLGGALGLAIAATSVQLVRTMAGSAIPRVDMIAIDGTVLLFTVLLVFAVTLSFGLAPALGVARRAIASGIRKTGRGSGIGEGHRLRNVLTMAEAALAVVLLFGAGLMLRTFEQLYAVDPGFETERVLRTSISLPGADYGDIETIRTFYRTLEERLAAQPGVEAVGSIYGAPLTSWSTTGDILVEGEPEPPPGQEMEAWVRPIGPGYFETMRIPLVEGRMLTREDDQSSIPVAVVNRAFARALFGDADPLGKRVMVTVDFGFGSPYHEIVGVVDDVRSLALTRDPVPELFVPHGQIGPRFMTVNVRTTLPPGSLVPTVRAEVARLDPNVALRDIQTVKETVRGETASTRFLLAMVGAFAGLALILAAIGIYAVTAYLVSRRKREVGVRVALGAGPMSILQLVLRGGLWPAVIGLGIGVVVSLAGGRLVEGVIYGISPRDPWTLGVVPLVLLGVAVLAVVIPARRAMKVDPATVLREE